MFEPQQRFGLAVPILLPEESPKSEPPVMPDDRGGVKCDNPPSLLNPPAEIDIIPGFAIFRIEAANAFERPAVKRHVTAGNMLGDGVCKQNMVWPARRRPNARLNPILCRRRDVRSADSRVIAAQKCANQMVEPILIGHAV